VFVLAGSGKGAEVEQVGTCVCSTPCPWKAPWKARACFGRIGSENIVIVVVDNINILSLKTRSRTKKLPTSRPILREGCCLLEGSVSEGLGLVGIYTSSFGDTSLFL
jgi:hypothetical protein